jgi:demethylmenaquinone methyltransferase/2-methoxy-6-polyprenyl-1,4-benzoquinol methylase
VGFFDWSAPLFAAFGNRWSASRVSGIADMLRPFLSEHPTVLDLGGGTGVLSSRLADVLPGAYTVVDPTRAMERYVPDRPDVRAVLGSAENVPFPGGSFDAVIVSDAFHHFADQDAAVREMRRVLRPGGGLVMLEFDPRAWPVAAVERVVDRSGHLFSPDELCAYLGERGFTGTCRPTGWMTYDFVGRASSASGSSPSATSASATSSSTARV